MTADAQLERRGPLVEFGKQGVSLSRIRSISRSSDALSDLSIRFARRSATRRQTRRFASRAFPPYLPNTASNHRPSALFLIAPNRAEPIPSFAASHSILNEHPDIADARLY